MNVGSLFSGIGGLELGIESLFNDVTIKWQAEADPHALKILEKHWPNARRFSDVRAVYDEKADIICGGFPCQDISSAGLKAGISEGTRSGLWFEFARIIRIVRPKLVFVENVGALVDRGIDVVLRDLAALGLDAEWGCFGACEAGRPHTRERLFILAYSDEVSIRERIRSRAKRTLQTFVDREMPQDIRLESDCELQRMANGFPREVDRLARLGNACCPQQAAYALNALLIQAVGN